MIVLLGVLLVVIGFALRVNPLLVVTVAGIVSALLAGLSPMHILDSFGIGFANSRSITLAFIVLPVIGLLERYGLQQRAKILISRATALTTGRLLLLYLGAHGKCSDPAAEVRRHFAPLVPCEVQRRTSST